MSNKKENDLVPISNLERQVCEMYAEGYSTDLISAEVGLDTKTVTNILRKKKNKELVKELITELNIASKEGRLRIMNRIIEEKIKAYEQNGKSLAESTTKDIPDLIMMVDNMLKEREKKELGATDNPVINILTQIFDKE